jgi:hypothetical protein
MSVISAGTTLTTALVQTGDTNGNLVFKTGASGTTALTLGSDQSATFAGAVSFSGGAFAAGSAGAPSITFTGDTNTGIFSPAADTIAFTEGGVESMRIDSSGNVGIGTSSPAQKLHVASAGTTAIQVQNTASSGGSYFKSTNTATTCNFGVDAIGGYVETVGAYSTLFYTNSLQRMIIDSSGNVGIGTSSPTAGGKLDVNGIAYFGTGDKVRIYSNNVLQGAGTLDIGTIGSAALIFNTANTERMRIDSSGSVFINTTAGVGSATSQLTIVSPNLFNTAAGIGIKNNTNNTGGYFAFFVNSSNSTIGSISQATASSVAYNTTSDYRLKENISPMTGALSKVSALKPVTYTWKADGVNGEGFIAHELAEVCPSAVTGEKDALDRDGNPKYQGIDTSFLVATLTAAIQEQQAIITDQASTIAAFEARLTALENK